jgi:hypothetical protein
MPPIKQCTITLFSKPWTHTLHVFTYDQNKVGVNSCGAPSCNAKFQLVLPIMTDTTCFASGEGSELGHVAWGKVVAAACSAAAAAAVVAAAAADSLGRDAVLAVVVLVELVAAAAVVAATTRLGDAVAPATTGALGDSILRFCWTNEQQQQTF